MDSARIAFELGQGWSKKLEVVFEDRQSSAALDFASGRYLTLKQVHGAHIHVLSARDYATAATASIAEADGFFAQGEAFRASGKCLAIRTADCMPLIYVDAKSEAVVALHAGWRGLAQGIHRLPFMNKWLDPKTTWAWLGPCLQAPHFTVKADMWSQFGAIAQDPTLFTPTAQDAERLFQAPTFLSRELSDLGVELLYDVEVDTFSDEAFASYRRARQAGLTATPDFNFSWVGFR